MMERENLDERSLIKKSGIYFWQMADHLGMSEASFTRMMRHKLSEEEKQKIIRAIHEIRSAR